MTLSASPHRLQCSTIGRLGLNHRVRDGNGCYPQAHRHRKIRVLKFCDTSEKIREKLVFLSTLFTMYQRDSRDRENFVLEVQQNVLLNLRTLIIKQ